MPIIMVRLTRKTAFVSDDGRRGIFEVRSAFHR